MSRLGFVALIVIGIAVRELIIWLGYSWIAGTVVAVLMILGFFVVLKRRLPKR